MENSALKDAILNNINQGDFSLSPMAMMDIMNEFNLSEEEIVWAYHNVVGEEMDELSAVSEEIMDNLRNRGNHFPSFKEFEKEFRDYNQQVSSKIIRDMHNKHSKDPNQLALFEAIRQEIRAVMEDDDFDQAAAMIKKWGGEIKKSPDAELSPEDIWDVIDAGDVARQDIESEFGAEDFMPMDDEEYGGIMKNVNEAAPLFRPMDANGQGLKKGDLVKSAVGEVEKTGRIMGFGDEGGQMVLMVNWAWPVIMKSTHPDEMGDERIAPDQVMLANTNEMNESLRLHGVSHGNEFIDILVDDAGLDYMKSEDPDSLAFDVMEAISVFRHDYNEDHPFINYLGMLLHKNDFKPSPMLGLDSLSEAGKMIYDTLVQGEEFYKDKYLDQAYSLDETMQEGTFDTTNLYKWFVDALYQLDDMTKEEMAQELERKFNEDYLYKLKRKEMANEENINEEELNEENVNEENLSEEELDEARGLGHSVKNTGDRNVKKDEKDHSKAPVTTLKESVDGRIKNLFEGSVKKKDLLSFINEEARKFADDIE